MKIKYIITLVLATWLGLTACTFMERQKGYDYSIKVTSADGYDCRIAWTGCYLGNEAMPFSAGGSWGVGNKSVGSEPPMSLPDTIRLIYYSLSEDQFYALKAPVSQDKIRPLLNTKYEREGYDEPATYSTFTVGIAPCGFVSLWLGGGAGKVLIDTFHAEKTEGDYRSAFPTGAWGREEAFKNYSEDLYPFIQQEMRDKRISSEYWEALNTAYPWKISFSDPRFSLSNYDIYLLNQENRMFRTDPDWPVAVGDKFIPVRMVLYLKHELDPIKYKVIIDIRDWYIAYDDEEYETTVMNHMTKSYKLLQFFKAFYYAADGDQVSVYIDLDDSMESLKLKLRSNEYEEEFPFYEYKIYDSERYNYK